MRFFKRRGVSEIPKSEEAAISHYCLASTRGGDAAGCLSVIGSEQKRDFVVMYLPFNMETLTMAYPFACKVRDNLKCPVVIYQRRGLHCPLTRPTFFVLGNDDDIELGARKISQLFPGKKMVLIGQSAGATSIVRLLGQPDRFPTIHRLVNAGVGISGALHSGMYSNMSAATERSFVSPVRDIIQRCLDGQIHTSDAKTASSHLARGVVACKKMGDMVKAEFRLMQHEYGWTTDACKLRFLPELHADKICKPLLFICGKDDPLCHHPEKYAHLVRNNPNVLLVMTDYGSHCDFADNGDKHSPGLTWAEKMAIMFVNAF